MGIKGGYVGIFDIFKSTPSQEKFAKIFAEFATKSGITKTLRFDPDEFRFIVGANAGSFNLHNAYRDYCAVKGAERSEVLTKYVQSLNVPDMPDSFDVAKKSLLPVIRGQGLVDYMRCMERLGESGGDATPAFQPFSGDAVLMLALDSEHSIRTVSISMLRQWGVHFEEAYNAAINNLRKKTVSKFSQLAPGLFVSDWNDSYDSSRILLPDVIYQVDVGANPIVMMPTRHRLFVASSTNKEALRTMLNYATKVTEEEGRPVSSLMYRFQNNGVVEYSPDDSELGQALHELRLRFLADDYASQKSQLEKIHEKEGTDIFVASYTVTQSKETGKLSSLSAWTKDVDTLLPQTDFIAFVSPTGVGTDADVNIVKWDEARKAFGHLMKEQDSFPPRFRVTEFPSQEQFEVITPIAL